MANRATTQDLYDRLLAAFREQPGVIRAAAKRTGIEWRRAKRAWEEGWPAKSLPPIKGVIEREQIIARERVRALTEQGVEASVAAQRSAEELAVAKARLADAAVKARAQEGDLVMANRQNALALSIAVAHMSEGAVKLSQKIKAALANNDISTREAVQLLRSLAAMSKSVTEAAMIALEMERLVLGDPAALLKSREPISVEEARRRITRSAEALGRAEQRGVLRVLNGGKADAGGASQTG